MRQLPESASTVSGQQTAGKGVNSGLATSQVHQTGLQTSNKRSTLLTREEGALVEYDFGLCSNQIEL